MEKISFFEKNVRNHIEKGLENKLERIPKQKSGYVIDIEKIKLNAQLMKKNGLDKKILATAKESYEESKKRLPYGKTHVQNEKPIAEILGIFGGDIKGMNVLDLGCGHGWHGLSYREETYIPMLSTALAYLGANVTGVDFIGYGYERSEERKKEIYEKWGFKYEDLDLTRVCFEGSIFENKDLIIARSLLNYGLEQPSLLPAVMHFDPKDEWRFYTNMIREIQKTNVKNALYNLEMPKDNSFKYALQEIDEKPISNEKKRKEKDAYLVNEFESKFGEIIYGEKRPLEQVFVIKELNE